MKSKRPGTWEHNTQRSVCPSLCGAWGLKWLWEVSFKNITGKSEHSVSYQVIRSSIWVVNLRSMITLLWRAIPILRCIYPLPRAQSKACREHHTYRELPNVTQWGNIWREAKRTGRQFHKMLETKQWVLIADVGVHSVVSVMLRFQTRSRMDQQASSRNAERRTFPAALRWHSTYSTEWD